MILSLDQAGSEAVESAGEEQKKIVENEQTLLNNAREDVKMLETKDEMIITDQNGKEMVLPKEERKALILAMGLNEKGKAEMKKENYKVALVFLLEAMEEYSRCRSELLKAADNYGKVLYSRLPNTPTCSFSYFKEKIVPVRA